jgi:starch phosphorylase
MSLDAVPPPQLPARLQGLAGIATNLAWSWHGEARALFRAIDQPLWHLTRHNPVELLRRVPQARLDALATDEHFLGQYDAVVRLMAAVSQPSPETWFAHDFPGVAVGPVAYFCAEFGLHNSVPIYSGGLGVLAGDHCKTASDLGVPLVGVGLFYTKGYSDQVLRLDGWQEDAAEQFDPAITPLTPVASPTGEAHLASVRLNGRTVYIGAWHLQVGRVAVYLLDTDLAGNHPEDRELSHRLYTGGTRTRLRQEWVLGVGGVRALRAVGVAPAAWHANEGHSAFMLVERMRELLAAGTPAEEAARQIRATSVFTTHTPVPAGHDTFPPDLVEECLGAPWEELGISRQRFFDLGRHPTQNPEHFHMTVMAMRLTRHIAAVSERHGRVSRGLWRDLWPDRPLEGVPIGHVTNGVHLRTWMAHSVRQLLRDHLGADWERHREDPEVWARVLTLDDTRVWATHQNLKAQLLEFIRQETRLRGREYWKDPLRLVGAGTLLSHGALTIGFARRFAAYKRADLVFRDPDRLRRLLLDDLRPVQLVFAGKAHPADDGGKQVLQRVFSFARDFGFEGRIAFLEDYEMHMAHRLVQGVDLWLNLPRVPLEASGTSGMKAALNGIPQLSTLDGWWAEGFTGRNGWALPPVPEGADVDAADAADADALYRVLEDEVVPLYYGRDSQGVSPGWVERMKNALYECGGRFTAQRMLRQYVAECYAPAMRRDTAGDDPPTG